MESLETSLVLCKQGVAGSIAVTSTNHFRFNEYLGRPTYAPLQQWHAAGTLADQCPNFGAHVSQFGGRNHPFSSSAPFPPIEALNLISENRARTCTRNAYFERIILDL